MNYSAGVARRGSYSKGIAKREEILTAALEIVARSGYSRATVRELADAVGLSQTGLLHYFGTKEELFTEILKRRDNVDREHYLDGGSPDGLVDLVRHNAEVPGLVQLYSRFSSEATEPGHPAHEYFRERYRLAREVLTTEVDRLQSVGDLPASIDTERLVVIVFALIDGLQMQWMFDPSVDMADHVAYFWELIQGVGRPGKTQR
jgi:AcrR family transcriptional regulator